MRFIFSIVKRSDNLSDQHKKNKKRTKIREKRAKQVVKTKQD
jgi:hypothetical protein